MEAYLITGLGNPGEKYAGTRHNAGFMALDKLCGELGVTLSEKKFKSLMGSAFRDGRKLVLIKPETYMNLSGDAVSEAVRYFDIAPERIIVFCDDAALPIGRIRIRPKGSAGGHNGLRSIIERLSTEDFGRIRIGIGTPEGETKLKNYVLGRFGPDEKKVMDHVTLQAAFAALSVIDSGFAKSMEHFNGMNIADV